MKITYIFFFALLVLAFYALAPELTANITVLIPAIATFILGLVLFKASAVLSLKEKQVKLAPLYVYTRNRYHKHNDPLRN